MPLRALLTRSAVGLLGLVLVGLAAVGGVSLGASGLLGVVLAAVLVACLAGGMVHDGDAPHPRQRAVDAGWRAGVGTVAVLLLFSGCAVLAGSGVTLLLAGGALVGWLARWALRRHRDGRPAAAPTVVCLPGDAGTAGTPVGELSVPELGREWLRTSAALAQARRSSARQALVDRRQEALDELERRDPAGFARWLAEGATVDSDPARYVSADPTAGYDAA